MRLHRCFGSVAFLGVLLPFIAFADLWTPAAPLPLRGAQAIVWLEGPLARSLPVTLLRNCYLADPSQRPMPVICLD